MKKVLIVTGIVAVLCYRASAQALITAKYASNHIGETVTVFDKVYNVTPIDSPKATILYLGDNYKNSYLTIIIKSPDVTKFVDKPEGYFIGHNIRATGELIKYKGKPALIVSDPLKLKIDLIDNIVRIPASRF